MLDGNDIKNALKDVEINLQSIDDCQEMIVQFFKEMEAPSEASEIVQALRDEFLQCIGIGDNRHMLHALNAAESVVVVEECAKMVPKEQLNGVVGLVYRLHRSRLLCLDRVMIQAEQSMNEMSQQLAVSVSEFLPADAAELVLAALKTVVDSFDDEDSRGESEIESAD